MHVTLGLIFVVALRKAWPMTFIAVRCPHCQSDQIGVPGAVSGKCTVRVMTQERSALGYISFVRENNHFGG
jgi:hypothetical protein